MVWLLALVLGSGTPRGDWLGPTGTVVRVYECGQAMCLKIVKLSAKESEDLDGHNPELGLRSRPLCGLTIGTGFQPDDSTHLSGGHVYDPVSGRTYKSKLELEGDQLKLRGYIGVSLLGRTESWRHVDPVEACPKRAG